ncbi:MAG: hypothetical protein JWN66_4991 [Sphingomonas bacterium]|uniref:hypothetical protein n=1 Tax=Sphingomonas bacterium TaxID=1895847 RepID=UPI002635217F|nr:hypothetical protein [Sphingomonas bacterium]MDB5707875.1 hypothetical protein [Sphingomonas bacterium]
MSEWRPIETAPKDGTWLLLGDFKEADEDQHDVGAAHFDDGKWTAPFLPDWYWRGKFAPTHWQRLPSPPY